MVSWLIRTLGGFTREEHNELLRRSSESHQMILSAKIAEIEALRNQLNDYREDRKFYQDKLFPTQQIQDEPKRDLVPISTGRIPWTRRKQALERQDREKLLKESKNQVDQTEAQIRAKNLRVEEEEKHA